MKTEKVWDEKEAEDMRARFLKWDADPNMINVRFQTWYKKRTIYEISRRLQRGRAIHQKLIENRFDRWLKDAIAVGHFWGHRLKKEKAVWPSDQEPDIYYNVNSEGAYSYNWGNFEPLMHSIDPAAFSKLRDKGINPKIAIQIVDDSQLPLMLNDPAFQDYRNAIIARLDGSLPKIECRHDLVAEHEKLQIKFDHMNSVRGILIELLHRFIMSKFQDNVYDRYQRDVLIMLEVEGATYHFYKGRSDDLREFDRVFKYTVTPDDMMV